VEHNPNEVSRLQALHVSVQAVLQHTPCAQRLESQSAPALHGEPFGFFPHEPFTQNLPVTHCESLVHSRKHSRPSLQIVGAQVMDREATHWPEALQVDAGVKDPAAQVESAHSKPSAYLAHTPLPLHNPLVPQLALP
jgi:hypothetical protein